ncbi:DUF433 domain-containing protein [Salinigranum marinum]|uniref:DUF433 domain-containing protein n=1 Tax=Salinigranum marinum TaxID=1515595 RepID=UPI002989CB89|nr:DUF433 domain-containing protein [Salinigranum marinum]
MEVLQSCIGVVKHRQHSDGAPTIEGTGTRVKDVAVAYEHSGYDPDAITQLYPDLSLGDVHRALAYYYDHVDAFRSAPTESSSA